ncbi:MAG: hypothetical protein HFF80_02410 [Oscillospiraceae bacterium]|nr:hypothetical protein [Oscillospiraceae bacterium]
MEILEKVAYMKGLAEGLGLDTKSKEGKLLKVMIDILDDVALELQDIRDEQGELEEGLDAVSDDLSDVETYLYEQDDEEDGDDEVYQTTCPNCEEDIFFDETILADGSILCPNCGEKLEFDLEDVSGCSNCCGACESGEAVGEDDEDDEED